MASMTMTASFLGSSAAAATASRRVMVVVKASKDSQSGKMVEERNNSTRRDLVFAVSAAAACFIAKVAEPKPGSLEPPDAKKKYAPICVTMPTARICRN